MTAMTAQAARKWLGLAILASALLLAVHTGMHQPREVKVVWLLSHLDRARLVRLQWRVTASNGSTAVALGSRMFLPGRAPEATPADVLQLPDGVTAVAVTCTFSLGADQKLTTHLQAPIGPGQQQTVDLDDCCAGCAH